MGGRQQTSCEWDVRRVKVCVAGWRVKDGKEGQGKEGRGLCDRVKIKVSKQDDRR